MGSIPFTKYFTSIFALFYLIQFSFSGDQKNVKSLIINSNKIKTILYNNGSISNPGVIGNVLDFTWNGLGYAYEFGFLAGARVPSAVNPFDSVNIMIDGFGATNKSIADGDFAPDALTKWGWLPTDKFSNSMTAEIANNQNPSTWNPLWSKWQGKFGDPIADMELVFEMDDATDAEFPYYPFPNDSSRRGLGLSVVARYYQFSNANIEDVLYTSYTITNNSDKPLPKVVSGIFGDPHIGGTNDFNDDATDFDNQNAILYSWDPDTIAFSSNRKPGYFGTLMFKTPMGKGVTSYSCTPYGGINRPKNDNLMYSYLSEGNFLSSFFNSSDSNNIGDYVLTLGTGFYSLDPNQSEEIGIAYVLAPELSSLLERAEITNREYKLRFSTKGTPITITVPSAGDNIQSSSIKIEWNTQTLDNDSSISLFYSNTGDERWKKIASGVPNSGSYDWDISSMNEGIFYKIHILNQKNETVSYDSTNGYFTINKPGDAVPEIHLLSPKNLTIGANIIPIQWIAGDADNDAVVIKIYYSENNGYSYTLVEQVANSGSYSFDSKKTANTPSARIKLEVSANNKSSFVESRSFRIANFYFALTDSAALKHVSGKATGIVFPGVADSSMVTGNTYRITFDSLNGNLTYNLKNLTTNQIKQTNELLNSITGSGTLVDGLRIWFKNDITGLDSSRSRFINTGTQNITVTYARPKVGSFRPMPIDVQFVFSSFDTNSIGEYTAPSDTLGNSLNPFGKVVKVPFKIMNLTDTTKLQAIVVEKPGATNGRWNFGEEIIVLTPLPYRLAVNNSSIGLTITKTDPLNPFSIPIGTKYNAYSTKPFTTHDVFEFTADVQYGEPTSASINEHTPKTFLLEQNYPNPFNPETRIQFRIAQKGMTLLKIFDAIGREIQTLVEEELPQGSYSKVWDGRNSFNQTVSSGVYFYRLQSGNFVQSKKMILMK